MAEQTMELPSLIHALREAGREPKPELLEAILAHGSAAVPPLLALLEEIPLTHRVSWRLDGTVGWAASLLSQLGAVEALPRLLALVPHSESVGSDFRDLMVRFGDAARPPLHAYLKGELGTPDPTTRERVVEALGAMGYHPETAALLIERAERCLHRAPSNLELAQVFGYALLTMRAPEAREILHELEDADPEEWFPETEEGIAAALARGPAPPAAVPDVVSLLKQRQAWNSLYGGSDDAEPFTYQPRPERDPEEQARKRAARQARRAAPLTAKPRPKPPGKSSRRR